jgi:ABC-type Fe3+-siderophore transport system permease subunit
MSDVNLSFIVKILKNENWLVERADQKAISMLSTLGVFMVFFIVYYRVLPINPFTATMIILYLIFALLSIFNLIMAIRPRTKRKPSALTTNEKRPMYDPAFYTGICAHPNVEAFKKTLLEVLKSEENIAEMYIREIYTVAQINTAKYKYVNRGVVLVIITLTIELILIAYLFIYHLGDGKMPSIF